MNKKDKEGVGRISTLLIHIYWCCRVWQLNTVFLYEDTCLVNNMYFRSFASDVRAQGVSKRSAELNSDT